MTDVTDQPTSFAMRESGAFFALALVLMTAPGVISLLLHHYVVAAGSLALFMSAMAAVFSSLQLLIQDGRLRLKLGGIITVRNVALADITGVERFRPPSLCGVGIRLLAEGTLYTVTMGDAVAIRLRNGSRFFIGSDTPDVMSKGIQSTIAVAAALP
jgi:hypothetical protein